MAAPPKRQLESSSQPPATAATVRQQLALLESEFGPSSPSTWLNLLDAVIDQLSDDAGIEAAAKVILLGEARQRIVQAIEAVTPKIPKIAPRLWSERPAKIKDPVAWTKDVYGQWLGIGLSQADIRQLDRQLYTALQNWKSRHGWPDDFFLPSRKEINDSYISKLTPEEVRENKRITEALRHRSRASG